MPLRDTTLCAITSLSISLYACAMYVTSVSSFERLKVLMDHNETSVYLIGFSKRFILFDRVWNIFLDYAVQLLSVSDNKILFLRILIRLSDQLLNVDARGIACEIFARSLAVVRFIVCVVNISGIVCNSCLDWEDIIYLMVKAGINVLLTIAWKDSLTVFHDYSHRLEELTDGTPSSC